MRILTWTLFGAAMAVLGFLASPAVSQDMLEPNPGIEDTIRGQMDAFLERDVAQAFTFASPNIQGMFGSAENFGRMVENGYPMVWTPRDVNFIDLQTLGGLIVQRVEVVDGAGQVHWLGYAMIETENGWRINGVQILQVPGVGA
ncbi:MAG: DUF4864 domain-containing protein [Pseudomonadota bacterium]